MGKPLSLSRADYLYNIQRDLESVARRAETHPDIFAKVVTDQELERIQEIVAKLVTGVERKIG